MPLKAVLFDMDGVIVDTEPIHKKAYFKMFESFGADVDEELYSTFAGASTRKVCNTVIDRFGLKDPVEKLEEVKRTLFKKYFYNDSEFDMVPGVSELIAHYYGNNIKMVLATSASHTTIDMVFERFDLKPFFNDVISGTDLKESKPNPEIFLKAAKLSGESAEQCMVIEDSTNGITAAHRAGIFCAGYNGGKTKLQDYSLADIVVTDFRELELQKLKPYF
ncbi:MAG: HAD family phosphatase [Weeksellaceae bacterium]